MDPISETSTTNVASTADNVAGNKNTAAAATTTTNNNNTNDDEETAADAQFAFAKAMALAIQNNPNLTTDEIHELMQTSSLSPPQVKPTVGGGTTGTTGKKGASSHGSHHNPQYLFKSLRDGAKKGINDIISKAQITTNTTSAAATATTAKVVGGVPTPTATPTTTTTTKSAPQTTITTTTTPTATAIKTEQVQAVSRNVDENSSKPAAVTTATASQPSSVTTIQKEGTTSVPAAVAAAAPTSVPSLQVPPSSVRTELVLPENKYASNKKQVSSDSISLDLSDIQDSTSFDTNTNTKTNPNTIDSTGQQSAAIPNNVSQPTASIVATPTIAAAASAPTTAATPVVATPTPAIPSGAAIAATTTTTTTGTVSYNSEHPIRLTGIYWKRRGGFGKYYKTDAWERRRIELSTTKIYYYECSPTEQAHQLQLQQQQAQLQQQQQVLSSTDTGDEGSVFTNDGGGTSTTFDYTPTTTKNSSDKLDYTGGGGGNNNAANNNTNRKSSWFEQAAALANFNINLAAGVVGGNNSNTGSITMTDTFDGNYPSSNNNGPRGYIDLVKEKAVVHASTGHSGAPSPFALSIVVKGETKWKICFDHHKEQMQWLAALTDVIVQYSVDTYNTQLLMAADPSSYMNVLTTNTTADTTTIFRQPPPRQPKEQIVNPTNAPPAGMMVGKYNRLWMMQPYNIKSQNWDGEDVFDEDGLNQSSSALDAKSVDNDTVDEDVFESDDDIDDIVDSSESEQLDHDALRKEIMELSDKVSYIPQHHLRNVAIVVNASLGLSRAYASAHIEGFWYVVVICNIITFYYMVVQEPDWRDIIQHVRAVPNKTSAGSSDVATKLVSQSAKSSKRTKSVKRSSGIKDVTDSTATVPSSNVEIQSAVEKPLSSDKAGYIPAAGCSGIRLEHETDPPVNSKDQIFAGWRKLPGEILPVRSFDYTTSKRKIPSPGSLYELVGVDVFEAPCRYPDMAHRVKLPEVSFDDSDIATKTWRCPDHFIVSIALPSDPPKMVGGGIDGGGFTLTVYFVMTQETRNILKRVTADGYDPANDPENKSDSPDKSKVNAVRLLEEWIRRAPSDPAFQARFKIVPNAHNLKEIGMPGWISRYNGKPFLIKRTGETGFLHIHPELSCVEFDVSLHPFPYLARKGICFLKDSFFSKVVITFGFVIEGRNDDELPECVIGLVQFCYPDPQYAIQADDFFNGTAPRSTD